MASGSGFSPDGLLHDSVFADAESLLFWLYYSAPVYWTSHPNYPSFVGALTELATQHGLSAHPDAVYSSAFQTSARIVNAGGDPMQIKAIFAMLFL